MPKPDNRKDNVERIQRNIDNTIENHQEAQDYLAAQEDEIPGQQAEEIRDKNVRRREAVEGLREEIKDEAKARDQR